MEKKYITATDLNKFVYCNYSYYYENEYGIKELRRLKKEYNEENGYTNTSDNFAKGRDFHNNYYYRNFFKKGFYVGIFLFIVILLVWCIFFYLGDFYGI